MNQQNKESLENICKQLTLAFEGVLSWKWDSRFETILAEFAADNKKRIRSTLEQYLAHTWDSSTVPNAPAIVQTVTNRLGGLMPSYFFRQTRTWSHLCLVPGGPGVTAKPFPSAWHRSVRNHPILKCQSK